MTILNFHQLEPNKTFIITFIYEKFIAMKIKLLYSILLMLLLTQFTKAQISLQISSLPPRNVEDFYGLNGQNTLNQASSYDNSFVRSGLLQSKASYLRYPGGTVANYWDWQEGWLFRNLEKNGALSLDVDLQNDDRWLGVFATGGTLNTSGLNYIEDFINTIANTGTKPLFVVNPLTSDLNYQIAMLLEAKLQNLEVKRVEIGNEFYLSTTAYQEKFANVQDYANLSTTWSSALKSYLGNDLKICLVGSNKDYTGAGNDRRNNWNNSLYNSMTGSLPEALAIHHYRDALPPSTTAFSSQTFFQKAIDDYNDMNNYIYQFGGSATNPLPIWLTEYNLFDRDLSIHGTWYHGLYTAFSTLKFLENNRITACNLHAQSGNYIFGNFFNNNNGLRQLGEFQACEQSASLTPPATIPYRKTSEGIAMEQIAIALKNATSGSRIDFNGSGIPVLDAGSPALYGWIFNQNGAVNNSAIIMNLSDISVTNVDVTSLGFTSADKSIKLSLSDPIYNWYYANGFMTSISTTLGNNVEYEFVSCGMTSGNASNPKMNVTPTYLPSNRLITLPPYSITRLEKSAINWRPVLYALNETVKSGSKVIVSVLNKDIIPFDWDSIYGNGNDSSAFIEFYPTQDTTITVRYTIPGSFTSSTVSKLIKVTPTPVTVSITQPTNLDYCPGTAPITLAASPGGGGPNPNYKYIWITTPTNDEFPDFNKGVGNTQSILVSPDFPTTYTVYVTDGQTVAKASITINVPTAFNLEPSYTSCFNTDIEIEIAKTPNANGNVTYTYLWQGLSNTISTTAGDPVKFTIPQPNASLSSVVTVTATTTGCVNIKSATVNFYNCCSTNRIQIDPGSDLFDLETKLSSLDPNLLFEKNDNGELLIKYNTIPAPRVQFVVNGDLHIRDNAGSGKFYTGLELKNADINFTEGASITVEPGFSLTLNNSNLDAECNEMWKGIIVDAGTLNAEAATLNGTSIKNAEVAINSFPGSDLTIRRTLFENNVVGIEADHQSADGDNLQFFNIWANEFKGVGTLKTHYIGQPFPIGALPYSGMLLSRVNSSIGVPNSMGSSNKFSNLNAGIICENSNLNFQNCDFLNIEIDNAYLYPAGTSIFALGNCKINGDDLKMEKWQSKTFPSYGIFLLQGNDLNIQNSKFTNLERAIQNDWSNFKNYNISFNTFNDCKTGIEWWESTSENVAEIYRNTFDATLDLNNHLIRPDLEAIHVFGGSRDFPFSIFENNINNHLVGVYAVQLNGKKYGQFIKNNHISLNLGQDYVNSFFDFRGISLQYCDFIKVLQNDITWNLTSRDDIGFRVEGIRFENCMYSLISDNLLTNLQRGIYAAGTCEETALLCNVMNVCYPSGMYFDGADLPSQGNFCGGGGNNWFGNYNQPQPSTYVFKIDEGLSGPQISWYYLGTNAPSNPLYPGPWKGNVVLPQLATNTCLPDLPCGFINNQERYYSGDSTFRASYIEKIIQDSISYNIYPDENKYFDKEYAVNVLLEDSNFVINNIHDQFLQAVDQENIIMLKEISTLLKSGEVNLAYIKNNSFLYRNVIEQNIGAVNSILLSKLINNNLSPFNTTQTNTLSNIAYQPAMLGGKGVYAARSLLRLRIEDGASSLRTYSNINKKEQSSYLTFVYPNPTHDFFNIKTNNSELYDLKIKDVSGKVLLEKFNCSNNTLFNCSSLNSGLYLVELQFKNGISEMLKLAIVH